MKKDKFIILLGDGMVDLPIGELSGKTPLEAARTPNMDCIAQEGLVGRAKMIPSRMSPNSDIAIMSVLGYNPRAYYTGRGPLEAANIGIKLKESEVAFRCNLLTVADGIMADFTGGHISNKEAGALISLLNKELGTDRIRFYPGVSYRNLMIINDPEGIFCKVSCTPPHDISGKEIKRFLPAGKGGEELAQLMEDSLRLLAEHDINKVRIDMRENPANMLWLWGQGVTPEMPSFEEKYGLSGAVVSAVDLVKGMGKLIGLEAIDVPGATGYYDTDYSAKAEYAIRALKDRDFVLVHVEAPDEAGHNGDLREKITAIENFDRLVVGKILAAFRKRKDYRILVLSDHPTPISLKRHTAEPICFALCGKGVARDAAIVLSERSASESSVEFKKGWELIEYLIKGEKADGLFICGK